ncbi:MAG: 1-(5-phosphoribosyl)-5-[(5-phosphoribosylamino) methylideneamino] imidazole-4-carboxamide isomerase [Candidatus Tectimicrobiota bacterium]|nr:MAG: 1-(5-phosphoribosyl)-5-[(5-phosphoribosylamino) methylideneamino] imidazole-4-carboxamide isomerase [Candidatus Tectomicrobia bacterium]
MQVIPAIDLRGGRCVRLVQGQAARQTVYDTDPVSVAQRWAEAGAPRLHVVDLDGAFTGKMHNLAVIAQLARSVAIPLQVGGGIRDLATLQAVFDSGVQWAVLGTAAVAQWEFLEAAVARFPGRVCVGIDSRDGRVAVQGWQETAAVTPQAVAARVAALDIAAIIYTNILRDGTLQGPDLSGIAALAQGVSVPVIASGGVATLEDLRRLAALQPLGVTGVIVGKALYEGRFSYQQAQAAVQAE